MNTKHLIQAGLKYDMKQYFLVNNILKCLAVERM
jgi:hypothetical protein